MLKSDFEILEEYLELRGHKKFLQSLEPLEQVLYKCQIRDTLDFKLYLLGRRMGEAAESITNALEQVASKLQASERRENDGEEEILPGCIDIPENKEP